VGGYRNPKHRVEGAKDHPKSSVWGMRQFVQIEETKVKGVFNLSLCGGSAEAGNIRASSIPYQAISRAYKCRPSATADSNGKIPN
jgi:hypothetical protein